MRNGCGGKRGRETGGEKRKRRSGWEEKREDVERGEEREKTERGVHVIDHVLMGVGVSTQTLHLTED